MSACHRSLAPVLLFVALPVFAASVQPLKPAKATASSQMAKYPAAKAIDGAISDASRWVSEESDKPAWLEIDLGGRHTLAGVHLYSGYGAEDPISAFRLLFLRDGKWVEIPSAAVTGNNAVALAVPFDATVEVTTDKLRLEITSSHQDMARVKELVIWPASAGDLPKIPGAAAASVADADIPKIYLNQSGFNLGAPKRFTAPTLPDGTPFVVRPAQGGSAVAQGLIRGQKGDFSSFDPSGDTREFVVEAGGLVSVPFRIGMWWLERVTYQNAVDFMIDSRHYVGNDRSVCTGSFGWRDDHHFAWELHTLVPQWISNPSAYERMPRQIRYEKPAKPGLWGALEPYPESAPDLVKLIHWGADVIVSQKLDHEFLKSQLAYFLYAWPVLEKHLPRQNYEAVRDYAFATWAKPGKSRTFPYDESPEHNLLALKTHIGNTKGAYPPGFSVEPNLLMYEVAKREKRPDAEVYLEAARKQAGWMIANLDWNDPMTTKGQRMSEFLTITGLAHLQRVYPDRAPAGLQQKIADWSKVVIRRSDNLWDFRKLDDADKWTPMGEKPTMWNEPGNVVGLPASLIAAAAVIDDPAVKARLWELVYSHFDNMFGRNPTGRHFSYDAPREIEGVEFGWYRFYPGGIGRLANARFVIDGSPKDGHYPYHPERGDYGWTEGWIQFNTPYNLSLSYLAWAQSRLETVREGDEVVVRLQAPLNFDAAKVETGTVQVVTSAGDEEAVRVSEESPNSRILTGRIKLSPGAAVKGDGILQSAPSVSVEASYGFGYLGIRSSRLGL